MSAEIVVGYDGSAVCGPAVDWAAAEARLRAVPLVVCHAWRPPWRGRAAEPLEMDGVEASAALVVEEALERVKAIAPEVVVKPMLVGGRPGPVLAGLAGVDRILVVGAGARLLGSVGAHLVEHAPGPVVVVREPADVAPELYPGGVVVAADGLMVAGEALAFAFDEARLRGAPLTVLCAVDQDEDTPVETVAAAVERLSRAVDLWRGLYPAVTAHVYVRAMSPVEAALAEAPGTQLFVVDSRGLGAVRGRMLGAVSGTLLRRAPCPVAVVHGS